MDGSWNRKLRDHIFSHHKQGAEQWQTGEGGTQGYEFSELPPGMHSFSPHLLKVP